MDEFYQQLAFILDEPAIKPEDVLADFSEWDSLSVLSVIAMLDAQYSVNINGKELRAFKTAGELANEIIRLKTKN